MRRTWINVGLVLLSGLLLVASVKAEEQKYCPLCSMNLKMYWKTSHWLTFSDGTRKGFCSIHCASEVYQQRATEIDRWEVADYDTENLVDARKAHFLIGSDLPGTMTPVSKLAFADMDTAKRYQAKHGGNLGSLDDALKRALEGRGEDMAMIKEKVAKMSALGNDLARKHGCYACHGEGGSGEKAVAWNSRDFALRMDSRVKIKEAVLGGGHGMDNYRGKITEQDLHAITVYVWRQRAQ
jgi:nitrous oxide reductase accessory protein NosL